MGAKTPILSAISIFFLAGGIVLSLFIILSGAINTLPMNQVFFLQAETNGISGSSNNPVPNPARWTYFAVCGARNGNNANCGPVTAALPFDPRRNFQTMNGLPQGFRNNDDYYYESRAAWAFYIIALFFAVMALFLSLLALCSRLAAKFTGMMALIAVVMQAVAAGLMTAWTVQARDAFRSNGQSASLGKYGYGFSWAAFACWLIAAVLLCVGGSGDRGDSSGQKKSYFGRKRSTRSRGSFRDSESGRRVKDEYE
ncbi:Eisosomes component [Saxophila tyrrhenica]|uniref:Eisosomes component n=1 Tax=Saxophila tyrrhenica TaxID=1690608 RepID=A0AAV9P0D4_9PEZI|nr:Eisosomes component [Saxophila tyrrhenica]